MTEAHRDEAAVRRSVRVAYGAIATGGSGGCCGAKASCCGSPDPAAPAIGIGYSREELAGLPEGANMGLSCGNPTALASLRPGEVVLDLGSGGGFDVFLAAPKVGPTGRVIGVDMTAEMIEKARANAAAFAERTGLTNVEFRLGEIEHLPVADATVDVIISNCVINLSPDKPQVWREMCRVLKAGGRVAVSDLALLQPLPDALRQSVQALVGCIAGAVLVDDTRTMALDAGFEDVCIEDKPGAVEAMTDWNDPLYRPVLAALPAGERLAEYVTSVNITARKPV